MTVFFINSSIERKFKIKPEWKFTQKTIKDDEYNKVYEFLDSKLIGNCFIFNSNGASYSDYLGLGQINNSIEFIFTEEEDLKNFELVGKLSDWFNFDSVLDIKTFTPAPTWIAPAPPYPLPPTGMISSTTFPTIHDPSITGYTSSITGTSCYSSILNEASILEDSYDYISFQPNTKNKC